MPDPEFRRYDAADFAAVTALWEEAGLLIERDNAKVVTYCQRNGYATDDLIFMEKWLA